MSDAVVRRSPGQPTLYKPEYCQLLIDHMTQGFSYETFPAVIGVAKQTIYNWEAAHPEFLDAKNTAMVQCRLFWEGLGIKLATGAIQGNAAIWIFNMINRFKWAQKAEIDVNHSHIQRPTITSHEELIRIVKRDPFLSDEEIEEVKIG